MTTHSHKKFEDTDLIEFRNRFNLPLTDDQVRTLTFYKPAPDSPEMRYLHERRQALGGYLPARQTQCDTLPVPDTDTWARFALHAQGKNMSTTMAFVRMLGTLLKAPELGPRIVPIVADEARTFGMANLFRQVGIYSSAGQHYEPEDIGSMLSYREALDGQILEEGISEAGAISSWVAAATSYSVHGTTMVPFYIYYSMFGFQRIGDLIWAAADQQPRGFLIGATSGRTTLGGEGLQHQDGASHVYAATVPNCKAYDPAFACELAVIVHRGMIEMVQEKRDVFYYITVMNENYAQPDLAPDTQEKIMQGAYVFSRHTPEMLTGTHEPHVTLMGSGAILTEVIRAAELLAAQGIGSTVVSVTSWSELARNGQQCEHTDETPFIQQELATTTGLIIAATDYVRLVPESIRAYIPSGRPYLTLGTDGFGRSDTRQALRKFFSVNAESIAAAAIKAYKKQENN